MPRFPLLIEFVAGSTVHREAEVVPRLPILNNGPPGTFVRLAVGGKIALPTDQIVSAVDGGGFAAVAFGGMSFEGDEDGRLVFYRVRDLLPDHQLSPERGRKMTLEPSTVAAVIVDGRQVWPVAGVQGSSARR